MNAEQRVLIIDSDLKNCKAIKYALNEYGIGAFYTLSVIDGISSLLMVVMNRRKEIALLLSLGATSKEIRKTFFWLGNLIGMGGIAFGVVLSILVLYVLSTFPIISLPADVYGITKLPIELSLGDFFATILGAMLIVCASSYYPAKKASEVDVLSVLRNE